MVINLLIFLVGKFILRILIKLFKWATEIFFGEMQEAKEVRFAVIFGCSLSWYISIVAILFPALYKIIAHKIPAGIVKEVVIVWLTTFIAFAIPPIVGYLVKGLNGNKENKSNLIWGLSGYKFCVVFGLSFFAMIIFTPIITAYRTIRRERFTHIPMKLNDTTVDEVFGMIMSNMEPQWNYALKSEGFMLRLPRKILKKVDRQLFTEDISQRYMLSGELGKIYINSMDITIEGKKSDINRLRLIIEEKLAMENINLTWSVSANRFEDLAYSIYKDDIKTVEDKFNELEEVIEKAKKSDCELFEMYRIISTVAVYEKRILAGYKKI